jgi:hypothetical protein
MSEVKTDKLSPRTASGTVTLGTSGDTFTIPSGVTLTNNGSSSGFGSPAYASNASATDDTVNVDASDNLQFNSGYGSTVTAFGVRAWVNFNGSGTVAIRASGNVSSITDNGTGDYTINFTTSMPDVNYAVVGSTGNSTITFDYTAGPLLANETFATGSIRLATGYSYATAGYFGAADWAQSCIGIIR